MMYQEVEVILTITANIHLSKEKIKEEILKLINNGSLTSTTYEKMLLPSISITKIKEEKEIYNTH